MTKTPGDDPSGNGRAEVAVKAFKNQIRRTLREAEEDSKWWPWALRYLNEVNRCVRMETKPEWPRFFAGGEGEKKDMEQRRPFYTS